MRSNFVRKSLRKYFFCFSFLIVTLTGLFFSASKAFAQTKDESLSKESFDSTVQQYTNNGWKLHAHDPGDPNTYATCNPTFICNETYFFCRPHEGSRTNSDIVRITKICDGQVIKRGPNPLDWCFEAFIKSTDVHTLTDIPGGWPECFATGFSQNSPSPTASPQNTCTLLPDEQKQKEMIIAQIKEKYKIPITDTNLCGKNNNTECGINLPWNLDQVREIQQTLDNLPACFLNKLNILGISGRRDDGANSWDTFVNKDVMKAMCCDKKADGSVNNFYGGYFPSSYDKITFCGNKYQSDKEYTLGGIIIHELTHSLQNNSSSILPDIGPIRYYGNPDVQAFLRQAGWLTNGNCWPLIGCSGATMSPPPDIPSKYAQKSKDPLEDMAESVRLYFQDPQTLKSISPRRYDFVKNNIMCGKEFTK